MATKNNPKISVIIRTYNAAGLVGRAIDSVLKQTIEPKNYEVLVVDDGSADDTGEVLEVYKSKIRLIRLKHSGKNVKVLNIGVARARGEYLIILDADDQLLPECLERMLKATEPDKSIGMVYGDYYETDATGATIKLWSLKKNIFNSIAAGILIKRKLIIDAGFYDENLFFSEYDLLIKLLKVKKIKSAYLPLPLYSYNRQPASVTADKRKVKRGFEQLKQKYGKNFPIRKY